MTTEFYTTAGQITALVFLIVLVAISLVAIIHTWGWPGGKLDKALSWLILIGGCYGLYSMYVEW